MCCALQGLAIIALLTRWTSSKPCRRIAAHKGPVYMHALEVAVGLPKQYLNAGALPT